MGNFSLFGDNAWQTAGGFSKDQTSVDNGHSQVVIIPNTTGLNTRAGLMTIRGTMKDALALDFSSEWAEMSDVNFPIMGGFAKTAGDMVGGLSMASGNGEAGAVWNSKKLWKKSGRLKLNMTIQVVDWSGTGEAVNAAMAMAQYTTHGGKDKAIDDLANAIKNGLIHWTDKTLDTLSELTGQVITKVTINEDANRLKDKLIAMAKQGELNAVDEFSDFFQLRQSPPSVRIKIGHYFDNNDMVIENVSSKFTKEVSIAGPLAVDIDITATGRKIIDGDQGIGLTNTLIKANRVKIKGK